MRHPIKPWDSRIAYRMIFPLRHSAIRPNHITFFNLALGIISGLFFATGNSTIANWAAGIFTATVLIDHCDGELARLTGKTSKFGHYLDHVVGVLIYIALFAGCGYGLGGESGPLGDFGMPLGISAGVSISLIFSLRLYIEKRYNKSAHDQPNFAGFEIEDIMYSVGPVTWLGGLVPFVVLAGVVTPFVALWPIVELIKRRGE